MHNKLSVLQARETAEQVGLTHAPSGPLSYSATASQCEAAGAGAHKKMSEVLKLDSNGAPLTITLPNIRDSTRENSHEISEARVSTFRSQGGEHYREVNVAFPSYFQTYN